MSSEAKKDITAPYGALYALWRRDWHKVNGGASRTRCGRLLGIKSTFGAELPPVSLRCAVCFPPWERLP